MRTLGASLLLAAVAVAGPAWAQLSPASAAIANAFFTEPAVAQTRALVVTVDGKPVFERYALGYGPGVRFVSWSMAKSITGTLIGQQVDAGALRLDAPAPVAAWASAGDPRGAITLRHLLHMSSGLRHQETTPTPEDDDTVRILFTDRAADSAGWSVRKTLYGAPGTKYRYSTATSMILADIFQRSALPGVTDPAQRRRGTAAWLNARLKTPAGMTSLVCEYDRAGTLLGGSLCHATARDWARFGEVYLNDGMGRGGRVVSADWVRFTRTPAVTDPGYGGHWWLNNPRSGGKAPALFPDQGPADAFAAIGHLGQYVIVLPGKRAVITRLGFTPDSRDAALVAALGRLANSLPDRPSSGSR